MKRFTQILLVLILLLTFASYTIESAQAGEFSSSFETTPDRVWPGRHYWPNPMENWRVQDGRLECTSTKSDRNLHLLTRSIQKKGGDFTMGVTLGRIAGTGSNAKSSFSLKGNESLQNGKQPSVVKRGLTIEAEFQEGGKQGVIVAQGGDRQGYSLFLQNGRAVFAVRNQGTINRIAAEDSIEGDVNKITVTLTKSGKATVLVNGDQVAEGMVGILVSQPAEGLHVGRDEGSQVGSYDKTFPFSGTIDRVKIQLGESLKKSGSTAGFSLGVQSEVKDYRARAFGAGVINGVVSADGKIMLGDRTRELPDEFSMEKLRLVIKGTMKEDHYSLSLSVLPEKSAEPIQTLSIETVDPRTVAGNVRLVSNPGRTVSRQSTRFWFRNWTLGGKAVAEHPDQGFGPILWTMYTLNETGNSEGDVMKMSVQMPPLGEQDRDRVELQVKKQGSWETEDTARFDPDARNAVFRVPNWPSDRDVPFRVVYETERTDGEIVRDTWRGTVRKNPDQQQTLSIADLNCQYGYGFPYEPVVRNVEKRDPDVLFFSGDQLYESNGGYGFVRFPADEAIISYLRKYYMFGWTFRDLMRDRPTMCIPDDHDVFQGNIWGEGGKKMESDRFTNRSGYVEPVRTVNAIYRSQTGHHPGVQNLEPAKRGVRVFYGDLVYGRLSIAVVADRQFKSGPEQVDTGKGRHDIVHSETLDPETLDQPGLTLLGERQLSFLKKWVRDWRGADMKTVFSQTTFSNPMTHTGPDRERVFADLDSNGWPQSGRNRALRVLRKGFAFHLAGDQHLTTLVHHGIKEQRDSIWTFVAPAICNFWPRWFVPDEVGMPHNNRPDHGLPNTGAYRDGFNNRMYVYALGNPPQNDVPEDAPAPYRKAHRLASGFGVAVYDFEERTITTESYKFYGGLEKSDEGNQYPGWPVTISQKSNYGRDRAGRLPQVSIKEISKPVVKVFTKDGELVYAIRSQQSTFEPFVFEPGTYEVRVGSPEQDRWKTYENLEPRTK